MGGNDILYGGDGNDVLDGGAGQDALYGGQGSDTYALADGTDTVSDDGGWDTITSTITRNLNDYPDIENLTLLGSANMNATGNAWSNVLTGNDGDNVLDGGPGADTLMGGLGNDTYVLGSATNDTVSDRGGIDTITSGITRDLRDYTGIENLTLINSTIANATGTDGVNVLTGNAGANVLTGLGGNDTLIGNGGNDTLIGGAGLDTMTGGTGNDVFAFTSLGDSGTGAAADVITDFERGKDKLDFSAIDANPETLVDDALSLLTTMGASFTHAAGEVRWYQDNQPGSALDATIVEIDSNGDGVADFALHLNGLVDLRSSDFLL
jgi:serralysin